MKKILAALALSAVLVSAFLGGLSILPHTHGDDFDHTHHKNCPVYQKSLHSADALATSMPLSFAVIFCSFLFLQISRLRPVTVRARCSSRAPPRSF